MGSVQRGGVIARNDNGTLERIDKTNTYIGSATLDSGRVITKRFRCTGFDEDDVIERWEKWQGKKNDSQLEYVGETEATMQNDKVKCPISANACTAACPLYSSGNNACALLLCGIALYNMSCNMERLNMTEPLELIAMAVGDMKNAPENQKDEASPMDTRNDGVASYLGDKTFLSFVNLYSKGVYNDYKRFCENEGFAIVSEAELSSAIIGKFPELVKKGVRGGSVFQAA